MSFSRCCALFSSVLAVPGLLSAQDWAKAKLDASPRHREYMNVQSGGRTVKVFVDYPESKGKAPVVVLIHEIFGLTDWSKEMADELAAQGYVVVEPDLLSGAAPGGGGTSSFAGQDAAIEAVSSLNPDQVTADLNAAADLGLKLPVSNGKLAVTGFCWGGGQSFRFATTRPDLKASFVFYGPTPDAASIKAIHAPVYGFYAGNDARITEMIPSTRMQMQAAGKQYEPVTYPGAGHGFMRAGEAPGATPDNKKARDEGFQRMLAELKKLQ